MTDSLVHRPGDPSDFSSGGATQRCLEMMISVAQNACDCAAKQYDDYYKSFAAFDVKAQATATISGVVLAAFVAIANAGRFQTLLASGRICGYLLVTLTPLFAFSAVIASLIASRVRAVTIPFDSIEQIREVDALTKLDCKQFSE